MALLSHSVTLRRTIYVVRHIENADFTPFYRILRDPYQVRIFQRCRDAQICRTSASLLHLPQHLFQEKLKTNAKNAYLSYPDTIETYIFILL